MQRKLRFGTGHVSGDPLVCSFWTSSEVLEWLFFDGPTDRAQVLSKREVAARLSFR
jgi:hypothetical protein